MWDELPGGWELTSLAHIAQDVQTGFACSAREEEGLPHLRPNNIGIDGKLDLTLVKRVPFEAGDLSRYDLKPEDVLFNNTNSQELVGKTAIFDLEGTYSFSNHLTRIRVRPDLLIAEWLSFWFQHLWHIHHFERICNRWIGQAGINTKKLSDVEVPVPPLPEQRRIVARIEELTERIDAARRLRAEAAKEAAAILPTALAEVFGEADEKGWEKHRLADVALIGTPKGWKPTPKDGKTPFIKMADIDQETGRNSRYAWADYNKVSKGKVKFQSDAILVAKITPCTENNKTAVVPEMPTDGGFATTEVFAVHPTGFTNRLYLLAFLRSPQVRSELVSSMTGSTGRQRVPKQSLENLEMPLLPLDGQRRIVEYLGAVQAKVEAIRRYQEETQQEIEAMRNKAEARHALANAPAELNGLADGVGADMGDEARDLGWAALPLGDRRRLIQEVDRALGMKTTAAECTAKMRWWQAKHGEARIALAVAI